MQIVVGTVLFFLGCIIQVFIVFYDPKKGVRTFFQLVGMMLMVPGIMLVWVVKCFG